MRSYNSKMKLSSCELCGETSCRPCEDGAVGSLQHSSSLFALSFILLYLVEHWLWFIFPRTSSKTSISRKSSVIVFFLQLMIAADDFENQLFPFLRGSWEMSATGRSLCRHVNLFTWSLCGRLSEWWHLCLFIFPSQKDFFFRRICFLQNKNVIFHYSCFVRDMIWGVCVWGGLSYICPSAFGLVLKKQQAALSLFLPTSVWLCLGSFLPSQQSFLVSTLLFSF